MRRIIPMLVALMLGLPAPAVACGAFFAAQQGDGALANGTGFELAIALNSSNTVIWDKVQWTGDASKFAWVLPVPVVPSEVALASEQFFQDLRNSTYPQVFPPPAEPRGPSGPGCASSNGEVLMAGGAAGPDEVKVVGQGAVGDYEWVVLQGSDAQSIDVWLVEKGYAVPASDKAVMGNYIDSGWLFMAMRFKLSAKANTARPLRITLPGNHPTVPLKLLRNSTQESMDLTIWALSTGRMAAKNYDSVTIDGSKLWWLTDQNRSTYPELLGTTVADAGGRAFVTEHAAPWSPWTWSGSPAASDYAALPTVSGGTIWVTRLRTRIAPDKLTEDLQLISSTDTSQKRSQFYLESDQKAWGGEASTFGLLALALLGLLLRRRQEP